MISKEQKEYDDLKYKLLMSEDKSSLARTVIALGRDIISLTVKLEVLSESMGDKQ